ncbi:MAG: hypothetical protein WBB23_23510 [Desulforhopalus sp.]
MSCIPVSPNPLRRLSRVLFCQMFCVLILISGSVQAMDSRFTDTDGDMIADIPSDPKDLIEPDTLVFTYTPEEDPSVYAKVWDGFIQHMEKVTGKKVNVHQHPICARSDRRT